MWYSNCVILHRNALILDEYKYKFHRILRMRYLFNHLNMKYGVYVVNFFDEKNFNFLAQIFLINTKYGPFIRLKIENLHVFAIFVFKL